MSHLSDYIKSFMADITLTNAQVLGARMALKNTTSKHGLTSVKLHRIRQRVFQDAENVAKAWVEIEEQFAVRENGAAKILERDGKPQSWLTTGTPAYICDPARGEERMAALNAFAAGTHQLTVPMLTEADLAWVESEGDCGEILALFTEPS